jgi:hypothetical protein
VPTISWPRSRRTAVMSWPAMRAGNDRAERHCAGYRLHRALAAHRAPAAPCSRISPCTRSSPCHA